MPSEHTGVKLRCECGENEQGGCISRLVHTITAITDPVQVATAAANEVTKQEVEKHAAQSLRAMKLFKQLELAQISSTVELPVPFFSFNYDQVTNIPTAKQLQASTLRI